MEVGNLQQDQNDSVLSRHGSIMPYVLGCDVMMKGQKELSGHHNMMMHILYSNLSFLTPLP